MASKRNLKLSNGTVVAVSGKVFTAAGIELIAHRMLLALTDEGPVFGTGFVVSEPLTGGLVVGRALTSQTLAISAAEERMARPGAADHVRHKMALQSPA